jgi:hypothetical protein
MGSFFAVGVLLGVAWSDINILGGEDGKGFIPTLLMTAAIPYIPPIPTVACRYSTLSPILLGDLLELECVELEVLGAGHHLVLGLGLIRGLELLHVFWVKSRHPRLSPIGILCGIHCGFWG